MAGHELRTFLLIFAVLIGLLIWCLSDRFIEQESGLADYPILLVTGYKSGTVSLLKVQMTGENV